MTYNLVTVDDGRCGARCPQAIAAEGTIEVDEPQRLLRFLAAADGNARVSSTLVVDSPGGNVYGALALGQGMRRLGATVLVGSVRRQSESGRAALMSGRCASACVFVLMGGRNRIVPDSSVVAVHQPRAMPGARDIVGSGSIGPQIRRESMTDGLRSYAQSMGVDPALVSLAESVPHESAHVLTRAEIQRFRLATMGATKVGRKARQR